MSAIITASQPIGITDKRQASLIKRLTRLRSTALGKALLVTITPNLLQVSLLFLNKNNRLFCLNLKALFFTSLKSELFNKRWLFVNEKFTFNLKAIKLLNAYGL